MATIKLELFKSKKLKDGRHPIMIRITHNRENKYVVTGVNAYPDEWDSSKEMVNKSYKENFKLTGPKYDQEIVSLMEKLSEAKNSLIELEMDTKFYTVVDLVNKIKKTETRATFYTLTEQIIEENKLSGRIGNMDTYKTCLNVVKKFTQNKDFFIDTINFKWLKDFEVFHLSRNKAVKKGSKEMKQNTVGGLNVYMRTIRSVYRRGIKEGTVKADKYPFKEDVYSIPSGVVQKRAIPLEKIKLIKNLQFQENTPLKFTQDMFLFMFYARGLNWVDLAHMKLKQIVNGRLEYTRAKTMRKKAVSFSIPVSSQMQEIISRYSFGKKHDDFVFPIIDRPNDPELKRADIKNKRKTFNDYLRKIGQLAGVEGHLTSYVARHSFATAGRDLKLPIATISEALGHRDIKTTQTYIKSISNTEIDEATDLITNI